MKSFGETIKEIRTARGITQSELAGSLINRTTLSKIENSFEEPSYENATKLIKRLGITQIEFDYIRNDYQFNAKEQIIFDLFNIAYNSEVNKIASLLNRCEQFPNDQEIQKIKVILKAFNASSLREARSLVIPLWKTQVSKTDNWNVLDLYLLNMIFFVFDDDTMIGISNRAIKTIEEKYPFLKSLETNFVLNKAAILMNRQNFDDAAMILVKAITLAKATFRYDKLLMAKGRLAICQKDKKEALYCLKVLKEIEADDVYNGLKDEIEQFDSRLS
ncbi:MAG: helix-turn-helix domain-containing protein [Lactobacillus apis]|uniref:helix-turn-helix domain-containing protein n=1 Tax=Lactobacillus sp. ESL0263 TaxID=2069350 RepID=UPI000EFBE9B7|nr:helix-turn-helix transcriptional regulator [Lactobacillus sp. ESL0263]MCT6877328.1 helix-turn-helix domain-containing protein [Lactobacillus apis]RMC51512.1 XRE family transcriptional regulator [Lactobacillus sp. ESL0263]